MNIGTFRQRTAHMQPSVLPASHTPTKEYTFLPLVDKAIHQALAEIQNGSKPFPSILETVKRSLREEYILKGLKKTSFAINQDAQGKWIYQYSGVTISAENLDKQIKRNKWWGEKLTMISTVLEKALRDKVNQQFKFQYEYVNPVHK